MKKKFALKQCSFYLFPGIFFMIVIVTMVIVDSLFFTNNRESFSGSLNLCDLHDVAMLTDASLSPVATASPFITLKPLEVKYMDMYDSVLSTNHYITLAPTTSSTPVPVTTTKPNNYKSVYANTLSENTFITSPGMSTAMTEMSKVKEMGLGAKKYDTVYNSVINDNKYNTTF